MDQFPGSSPGKTGRKSKADTPAARAPQVEHYVAPPLKTKAVTSETDLLEAMEAMKPLVAQFGAEKVKRIADLLG